MAFSGCSELCGAKRGFSKLHTCYLTKLRSSHSLVILHTAITFFYITICKITARADVMGDLWVDLCVFKVDTYRIWQGRTARTDLKFCTLVLIFFSLRIAEFQCNNSFLATCGSIYVFSRVTPKWHTIDFAEKAHVPQTCNFAHSNYIFLFYYLQNDSSCRWNGRPVGRFMCFRKRHKTEFDKEALLAQTWNFVKCNKLLKKQVLLNFKVIQCFLTKVQWDFCRYKNATF